MILVIIKMTALPSKCKEFLQTVQALIQSIRRLKVCTKCFACQDFENENSFCTIQEWENQKALYSYLQSELFEVFLESKIL